MERKRGGAHSSIHLYGQNAHCAPGTALGSGHMAVMNGTHEVHGLGPAGRHMLNNKERHSVIPRVKSFREKKNTAGKQRELWRWPGQASLRR